MLENTMNIVIYLYTLKPDFPALEAGTVPAVSCLPLHKSTILAFQEVFQENLRAECTGVTSPISIFFCVGKKEELRFQHTCVLV